jgi:hypothetical protein
LIENSINFGKTRDKITKLLLNDKGLTGTLDLTSFKKLSVLDLHGNKISELKIHPDTKLVELNVDKNPIKALIPEFLLNLKTNRLKSLYLNDELESKLIRYLRKNETFVSLIDVSNYSPTENNKNIEKKIDTKKVDLLTLFKRWQNANQERIFIPEKKKSIFFSS